MAAVLAQGETIIRNAAREPEVEDLARLLNKMGARIEGAGTSTIRVEGVSRLHGAEHTIIADCVPEHLDALVVKLRQAGAEVSLARPGALRVRASGRLKSIDIGTEEYP